MTSPYEGLRSGAAPEALPVGYVNPAFVPRPWQRTAHEDDEAAPPTTLRTPLPNTILEGDSSDMDRAEYQGADTLSRERAARLVQNQPQYVEHGFPVPSVPKWRHDPPEQRPHVQTSFYDVMRPYSELASGVLSNQGNTFGYFDPVTYVEQGQTARGYMQPSTYTPRPDPYGKDLTVFPSDGPATGDRPSSWS